MSRVHQRRGCVPARKTRAAARENAPHLLMNPTGDKDRRRMLASAGPTNA